MMASPLTRAETWDALAADYDECIHPLFAQFVKSALDSVPLNSSYRVLDVACGPGTAAIQLASRVAEVQAVDLSPEMVQRCAENAERAGLSNLIARQMNGQHLSYADSEFDLVVCMFGLVFFSDVEKGVREFARVLRPGGRILLSCWSAELTPTGHLLVQAFKAAQESAGHRPPTSAGVSRFGDEDALRALLKRARLDDVRVWKVKEPQPVATAEQLWDTFEGSSALVLHAKSQVSPECWAHMRRVAIDHIASNARGILEFTPTALFAVGQSGVSALHKPGARLGSTLE